MSEKLFGGPKVVYEQPDIMARRWANARGPECEVFLVCPKCGGCQTTALGQLRLDYMHARCHHCELIWFVGPIGTDPRRTLWFGLWPVSFWLN